MGKTFTLPKMHEQKTQTVTALADGGLNLADTARHIADSESPDMCNFWRHEGQLRLRPGLRKMIEHDFGRVISVYPNDGRRVLLRKVIKNGETVEQKYGIYIVTQKAVLCFDGSAVERIPSALRFEDDGWVSDYADYNFEKCVFVPSGSDNDSGFTDDGVTWTVKGEKVYIVGSNYFLEVSPQIIVYEMPVRVPHITAACIVKDVDPYVPVLYEDCKPDGTGTKVEPRNIISNTNIQKFTTDASTNVYKLCDDNIDNAYVRVIYTTNGGSVYDFSFQPDVSLTKNNSLMAALNRKKGTITFTANLIDASAYGMKNNLVVTYTKTAYTENPVCSSSIGIWYDGGTQNAAGYSRVFLSGFSKTPNRIYYSAANDPTYFPEDAYIEIGEPADPITAFGIQYDVLAVFKKNSIYSLSYSNTADSANFTIKMVHSSIGCDMPATLRLASNALVWASSAGGVYALQSTTIKDERAVRLVSKKINSKLLSLDPDDLQTASAVCDGSSYFLLAGRSAFIMNYEQLHFKSGQGAEGIAWFVWSLPEKLTGVFRYGSNFAASSAEDGTVYLFDDNAGDDCGRFFDAYWYSKSLDFGAPETLKRLYRFILTVGCKEPIQLEIRFADSAGDTRRMVSVDGSGSFEKTLGFSPAAAWSRFASIGVRRAKSSLAPFSIIEYTAMAALGATAG